MGGEGVILEPFPRVSFEIYEDNRFSNNPVDSQG